MNTTTDASFGFIPLQIREQTPYVFLIQQIGSRGDTFWTFPKGHPEQGESPKETAERELFEETGLRVLEYYEKTYVQSYTFVYNETLIEKTVTYFSGEVIGESHVQVDEVADAGWFTIVDALTLLTFESAQQVLQQVALDVRVSVG